MLYEELKMLIRYLKRLVKCSNCQRNFLDKDISILATLPTEAIFQLECRECKHIMLVNIGMRQDRDISTIITKKDVKSMQDFLKKFNGDFKTLFTK